MPQCSRPSHRRALSDRLDPSHDRIRPEACRRVLLGGGVQRQGRPRGSRGRAAGLSASVVRPDASRGYERVNVAASVWSHVFDLASLEK